MTEDILFFRKKLYIWAAENPRPMPWKGERDPYKIWLSEIILQQTRVEQGWPYYEKFIAKYPTVRSLADASEDEVLKLWEGLGYYTRARNMHAAARHIAYSMNGIFPASYEDIRSLKGVGDYTAAAIASFAFNLPHAVLDGNVYRVLSRFFAIDTPTDLPAAKKQFAALAYEVLDPALPAAYNQALMDFGALCCTPVQPRCALCPLGEKCLAFLENRVDELPVRIKKIKRRKRFFLYLKISQAGHTFLRKRSASDIWQGLYEFPMYEVGTAEDLTLAALMQRYFSAGLPDGAVWGKVSPHFQQILTHQGVVAAFIELHLPVEIPVHFFDNELLEKCIKVLEIDVKKKFALPRVIVGFLEKNI